MLTFEQIKQLIDIVCQKGLQGLEVERSDFRLRIDGQAGTRVVGAKTDGASQVVLAPVASDSTEAGGAAASGVDIASTEGLHTITSPIVGTFYSAPSPEADPYVQIGDEVKVGQVLCIVEAMKLMNEIESDVGGVVVEIHGRNSQPVEFGEALFAIEPAS